MTRKLRILLPLVAALAAPAARASIAEVAARESTANLTASSLEQFKVARDRDSLGDRGLYAAVRDYTTKANAWLDAWSTFHARLAGTSASTFEDVEAAVVVFVRRQSDDFVALERQADEIQARRSRLAKDLRQGSELTESEALQDEIRDLLDKRRQVGEGGEAIATSVAATQAKLRQFQNAHGIDVLLLAVKGRLIAAGLADVDAKLVEARAFVLGELLTEPLIANLRQLGLDLRGSVLDLTYRTAEAKAATLTAACAAATATIDSAAGLGTRKNDLKAEVAQTCQQPLDQLAHLKASYGRQDIAVSMQKKMVRLYNTRCQVARQLYGCAEFDWLKDLSEAQIRTFKDADLDLLETHWQSVQHP